MCSPSCGCSAGRELAGAEVLAGANGDTWVMPVCARGMDQPPQNIKGKAVARTTQVPQALGSVPTSPPPS